MNKYHSIKTVSFEDYQEEESVKKSNYLMDMEFGVSTIYDNGVKMVLKNKDVEPYIKSSIDNWFFSNGSMGSEMLLAHMDELEEMF